MKLNIWTASREEQLSSDILSWEIICFQVTKTCGTQPAAKLLASPCCDGGLAHGGLILERAGHVRRSPEPHLGTCSFMEGGINVCLLEGSISYTKSSNFNPFPGISIFMK